MLMNKMYKNIQDASSSIKVKTYKNTRDFERDARKMERQGWEVQSVVNQQPRPGVGRIVMLGLFAGVFKPKPILVVTYKRNRI